MGGTLLVVVTYLATCFIIYMVRRERDINRAVVAPISEDEIDRHLEALDEANEFFAGALRPADTFRLIANRVHNLLPFNTISLLLLDATRTGLLVAETEGKFTAGQTGRAFGFDDGLAGRSFDSGVVEFDLEAPAPAEKDHPAVAIPLKRGSEIFGVLQLFFDSDHDPQVVDSAIFDAVGTRVSGLILSAIALERSQTKALTDAITEMPNERAFFMVLETQIAESMRKGGERPLTILAIDIQDFDEINRDFGHTVGDKVLSHAAKNIKHCMRQMDFCARSSSDEFLVVLPTASRDTSLDIVDRIEAVFVHNGLKTGASSVEIRLNFGMASFGVDGETAAQLLSVARLRKEQGKCGEPENVLWFAKEFVN
jgi:diguanylate cyclase (GGDEF)-like protein